MACWILGRRSTTWDPGLVRTKERTGGEEEEQRKGFVSEISWGTDTGKTGEPAAVRTMLAGRSESRIRNAAEDRAISSRTLRYGGKRWCAVPCLEAELKMQAGQRRDSASSTFS